MEKVSKKISIVLFALLIFFEIFLLNACSASTNTVDYVYYDFLGTSVSVVIQAENTFFWQKNKLDDCYKQIEKRLKQIDETFSTENQNSLIYAYNQLSTSGEIQVNDDFEKVYQSALYINEQTDGAFNPAIKNLVDLWGFSKRHTQADYQPVTKYDREMFSGGGFSLPEQKYITAFKSLTNVLPTITNGVIVKQAKGEVVDDIQYFQQLDLSGLVKGYTADEISSIIFSCGYEYFYVSIGSSSMWLSSENGSSYKLGVTDPNNRYGESFCVIDVKDKAVSTSGVYENNYVVDGELYHHIIDVKTGKPAISEVLSITLIGENGCHLDALTTALLCLGKSQAIATLNEKFSQTEYIIICSDNQVYTNINQGFELKNNEYSVNFQ